MSADPALRIAAPSCGSVASVEALRDRPEAGQRGTLTAAVEPLLVDTNQAALRCGISPASWYRLKAAGKTPAPLRLGGRVLYRVEDLQLWVSLGCPPRKEFEVRRGTGNASGRPR
jgi:predicted DNA-binding transcriptional regulator AlpA